MKKILLLALLLVISAGYFIFSAMKKSENHEDNLAKFANISANAGCLIVNKNKEILMTRSAITGKYHIPGGTMVPGEFVLQTATRETHEETGVQPNILKLFKIYDNEFYLFFCNINETEIDENHKFQNEIDQVKWINVSQINEAFLRFPQEYNEIIQDPHFISFSLKHG